ncbi:MAG: amidase family protein, partial [Verrucomicrobiota bacterium]|nr:amidase family protein [Verrucomicrobiota bacterium]
VRNQNTDLSTSYKKTRAEGFGSEVKRRIILGTYVLSSGYYDAYYKKAQKVRALIKKDFSKAFDVCDVIISPVSPTTAYPKGEKINDPLKMYLDDILTTSVNLAGNCAISIPCGFNNNLPVGLQIIGDHFNEELILKTANIYEKSTEFKDKKPTF